MSQLLPSDMVEVCFLNELPSKKVMAEEGEHEKAEDGTRNQSYPGDGRTLSNYTPPIVILYLATLTSNRDTRPDF